MTRYLLQIVAVTAMIVLCIFAPFLPGAYDPLAVPLSTTVQLLAAAGLLLVPIGIIWLAYELAVRASPKPSPASTHRRYYFALTTLLAATVLVTAVSLLVLGGISTALGLLLLAGWTYLIMRSIPALRRLKSDNIRHFQPLPLFVIAVPLAVLLITLLFMTGITNFSRNRAIANSQEFVSHIEQYHAEYGSYPVSLAAMWKDYYPDVVGIEKYHYAPQRDSYNLFFEQPRLLFDNIGTREWVVYNPGDDHRMYSHTAWFLLLTPAELERSQGWYAVHDAKVAHWKCFWFD
jgi:hypothetical protein